MRTNDFETEVLKLTQQKIRTTWPYKIHRTVPLIRLLLVSVNQSYKGKEYSKIAEFKVPTELGVVDLIIGERNKTFDFYYPNIENFKNTNDDLQKLFEQYLIMKALRQ